MHLVQNRNLVFHLSSFTLSTDSIIPWIALPNKCSFLFFTIHLPPVEEGEFLLYIMLKCFNTSTIALSLSSGHCGCLLSSFLGKLGLGTSSKSVAAVVELPCKQSILLVATRKFFATSILHFLFTCEMP